LFQVSLLGDFMSLPEFHITADMADDFQRRAEERSATVSRSSMV